MQQHGENLQDCILRRLQDHGKPVAHTKMVEYLHRNAKNPEDPPEVPGEDECQLYLYDEDSESGFIIRNEGGGLFKAEEWRNGDIADNAYGPYAAMKQWTEEKGSFEKSNRIAAMKADVSQEQIERAIWLQNDAAYLYGEAVKARDSGKPASAWVAARIQDSAAHSARLAREIMCIEA